MQINFKRKMGASNFVIIALVLACSLLAVNATADAFDGYDQVVVMKNCEDNPACATTISGAMVILNEGGSVAVSGGTYYECLSINKAMSIASTEGAEVIIDGSACGRDIVSIHTNNITLSGLNIKNYATSTASAIRACEDGNLSNIILSNITITEAKNKTGIYFNDASNVQLRNSELRNLCQGIYFANSADVFIDSNIVADNGLSDEICSNPITGIELTSVGTTTVSNNLIFGNDVNMHIDYGNVDCSENITISHNKIYGSLGRGDISPYGIFNHCNSNVNAYLNWWGDETGPMHDSNQNGSGDIVSNGVNFSPWFADENMQVWRAITNSEDGKEQLTLPSEYNMTVSGISVTIPSGTKITGSVGWTGQINPPTLISSIASRPSIEGMNIDMGSMIEIGFPDVKLSFDRGVRVVIPAEAGKRAGYTRAGEAFTEITAVCAEDDQTWANDNLLADGDCKINDSGDMVVWTKHFTQFATFSATAVVASPSSGGAVMLNNISSNCQNVVYGDWQSCINGMRFRNLLSRSSEGCVLSAEQEAQRSEKCGEVLGEKIEEVSGIEIGAKNLPYQDDVLLRALNHKIYVIKNGMKKHVINLVDLYEYRNFETIDVSDDVLAIYPEVLGTKSYGDGELIRGTDMKIYVIMNGKKEHITTLEELRKSYAGKKINNLSDDDLLNY